MQTTINKYITERYPRWLDHAEYHCSLKGISDEAIDILNEVMVDLLKKDIRKLTSLYIEQKDKYRGLDFYVLRMIKLNVYSPTSPYQSRYKKANEELNFDFSRHYYNPEVEEEEDRPGKIMERVDMVRKAYETIYLSEHAKEIFEFKFFHGCSFSEWTGPESKKELYDIYNSIIDMIRDKINGRSLF